ncbi:MAG: GNAT family N-acetyltransferase [Clostridia bacterium]|nr:GNAT family N-acetyltransferase [Clostridia bacterium]
MHIETQRLVLRRLRATDYPALCRIVCDEEVMYAYEGAFSDEEARSWLQGQLLRYRRDGFGLNAVILKESGEMIGQCGLSLQSWNGRTVHEIGYLFQKAHWHRGYATEAAAACLDYAFRVLAVDEVFSLIRDTNAASRAVALRNGMKRAGAFVKRYRGVDMPHEAFSIRREAWAACPDSAGGPSEAPA